MSPAVSNIASQVQSTLQSISHSLAGSKAASKAGTRRGSLGKGEKTTVRRQSADTKSDRLGSAGRRHSQEKEEKRVSPSPSCDPLDDAAKATEEAKQRDKKRHSSHDKMKHHKQHRSDGASSSSHHRNSAPHPLDSPRQLSPGGSRPDSPRLPGEADGSPTGRSPAHSAVTDSSHPRSPTSASPTPGSKPKDREKRSSLLGSRGSLRINNHISFDNADAGAGPSKPVVVDPPATTAVVPATTAVVPAAPAAAAATPDASAGAASSSSK